MIYLYYDTSSSSSCRVICYLLEPNGARFIQKHPSGFHRLQQAWAYVKQHLHHRFDFGSRVKVVGEQLTTQYGLQTLLGDYTKHTRKSKAHLVKTYRREGYGICGAVTFWLFHTWLSSGMNQPLDRFYKQVVKYVFKHRLKAQHLIYTFMKDINEKTRQFYATKTESYLKNDMKRIQKQLSNTYSKVFRTHGLVVSFSVHIAILISKRNKELQDPLVQHKITVG
jgi:hypothetical protein